MNEKKKKNPDNLLSEDTINTAHLDPSCPKSAAAKSFLTHGTDYQTSPFSYLVTDFSFIFSLAAFQNLLIQCEDQKDVTSLKCSF